MKRTLLLLIALLLPVFSFSQNGESSISYKNIAIQASSLHLNGDAKSAATSSVASYNGFGSYLENPAVMALAKQSTYSLGWFNQRNNASSSYLGTTNNANYSKTNFGSIGFVYKVPTAIGSFVLGGGYTLVAKNNEETLISGFNQNNSITDYFKQPNSDYGGVDGAAFNVFAVDYKSNTGNDLESIFRLNSRPNGFQGIQQYAAIDNEKTVGDISIFASTEFKKNLYAGISLGIINGTIQYNRDFQEVDENNLYSDDVVPADGTNPATDIYSVNLYEELGTEFYGVSTRGGLVFKPNRYLSLGGSITLPTRLLISENFYANLESEFDDLTKSELEVISSEFSYAINKPAEFRIGASVSNGSNANISASVEYINYANTEIDFSRDTHDFTLAEIAGLEEDQKAINASIKDTYAAVLNLKTSASYSLSNNLTFLAGFGYYPAKSKSYVSNESVYSGGVSFPVMENISVEITAQYLNRDDRSLQYEFENNNSQLVQSYVDKKFDSFQILGGLTIGF